VPLGPGRSTTKNWSSTARSPNTAPELRNAFTSVSAIDRSVSAALLNGLHRHLPSSRTTATANPSRSSYSSEVALFVPERCAAMRATVVGSRSNVELVCQSVRVTGDQRVPVCVLGTGLIGGSVLRAARDAGYEAFAYNRSEAGARAARADGFDVVADLPAVLRRVAATDALVVLAVPMPAVDHMLSMIAEYAPGCLPTDVVSVKAPVAEAVSKHGLSDRYVGGHPMAGTAESGWAATDSGLFRGAVWAVGVDEGTKVEPWTQVVRLALACGSVVVPVVAAEHDRAVARISHLPHVLAEA